MSGTEAGEGPSLSCPVIGSMVLTTLVRTDSRVLVSLVSRVATDNLGSSTAGVAKQNMPKTREVNTERVNERMTDGERSVLTAVWGRGMKNLVK